MSALLIPTARATPSIAASWTPCSSNSSRVAATIWRSRSARAMAGVLTADETTSVNNGYTLVHGRDRNRDPHLLPRPQPGPARHPRVGPWLLREHRPPRRRGVGRARGDALADHPGGRQDRPLRLRVDRPVLGRPDRPDAAGRQRGALLGRRRDRYGDH